MFTFIGSFQLIEFIFITVHIMYHHISTAQQIGAMVSSITEESDSVDKTILTISGRKTKIDEL